MLVLGVHLFFSIRTKQPETPIRFIELASIVVGKEKI